jgi:hypothetical protein
VAVAGVAVVAPAAAAGHQGHGDTMSIVRFFRHLFTTRWHLNNLFPDPELARIAGAVSASELHHRGQIVVALEAAHPLESLLDGITPRQRAELSFRHLNVWDTTENTGVMLYMCLADHDFEIVADRGIHAVVGQAGWEEICQETETLLRQNVSADALIFAIERIGALMQAHFPRTSPAIADELPNRPVIL